MATVLRWVNDIRLRHDLPALAELPAGQGRRSPVEVALGAKVTLGRLQLDQGSRITFIEPPPLIVRHITEYRTIRKEP
jgi:hypothetical protein